MEDLDGEYGISREEKGKEEPNNWRSTLWKCMGKIPGNNSIIFTFHSNLTSTGKTKSL